MTALFDNPVRATTTVGEDQILVLGVVTDPVPRLLVNHGNGEVETMDISDVVTHWRYGTIPYGRRSGQVGWYDFVPEGEEPNPEVDSTYLDDPDA
jgi:hypothetical protein